MAVTSAWTNPAGAVLDKATGNTLDETFFDTLASNLLWLGGTTGTWTAFTPTLTQSGAVTITVTKARYVIIGKTALVQIQLDVTGSGSAGNNIIIGSIPAAIQPAHTGTRAICGGGYILDSGTTGYGGLSARAASSTTVDFLGFNQASGMGTTPSFALASGDVVSCLLAFEIA